MKYYVMSFPWMFVIYCWVDHGNMTRNVVHDGRKNTYTLEKNCRTHMLLSIKDKEVKIEMSNTVLLMSGKELLDEVKKKEDT
jgi:hypothetical protein